jgi:beta-mannosidase
MIPREVTPLKDGWRFSEASSFPSKSYPAGPLPTNIHLDLLSNQLIEDPHFSKNESDVQWVGEKAWVYFLTFATPPIDDSAHAVLEFNGLDTYATVELNGEIILKTADMFIPERVDITEVLKEEGEINELTIRFESAFLIGKQAMVQYKQEDPTHLWSCWNGHPSRLAVRKAQYHYVHTPFSLCLFVFPSRFTVFNMLYISPSTKAMLSNPISVIFHQSV